MVIIIIFATSLAFLSHVNTKADTGTLKVLVNLQNVANNVGIYEVRLTAYGIETLEQSKTVHTGTQTCPDDADTLCYTASEAFSFPSENVPVGSKIRACVVEPATGAENCADGQNSPNNGPETIWVEVPDKPNN